MTEKTNPEAAGTGIEETITKESDIKAQPEAKTPEIDWKTQAAYYAAEVDNMRKRFLNEASELRKYANEDLLKKILPVLDTLTLALQAAEKAKGIPENETLFSSKMFLSFIQGVEMTAKQFESVLQSCGVEFIRAAGQKFDPLLHEAVGQMSLEDVEDHKVIEELSRGFRVGGRVVRPAKVMVNVIKREQV